MTCTDFVPQSLRLFDPSSLLTRPLPSVNACDRPAKYEELKAEFADKVRDL